MAKICNINFWIENDPPPPSEPFGGQLPLPGKCEYLPDRHFRPIWYLLVRHTPSTRIIILPNKCASLGQWHFRPTWNLLVRHTPSKRIAIFIRKFPGPDLSPKLVHCNLLCIEEQSPSKDADSPAAAVGKLCAVCTPTHGAGAEHVRAGEPGDARVGLGSSTNLASWTVSLLRATTLWAGPNLFNRWKHLLGFSQTRPSLCCANACGWSRQLGRHRWLHSLCFAYDQWHY